MAKHERPPNHAHRHSVTTLHPVSHPRRWDYLSRWDQRSSALHDGLDLELLYEEGSLPYPPTTPLSQWHPSSSGRVLPHGPSTYEPRHAAPGLHRATSMTSSSLRALRYPTPVMPGWETVLPDRMFRAAIAGKVKPVKAWPRPTPHSALPTPCTLPRWSVHTRAADSVYRLPRVAQAWLRAGGSIDARGPTYHRTLLMVACDHGHERLVELLLSRGAHEQGHTTKMHAHTVHLAHVALCLIPRTICGTGAQRHLRNKEGYAALHLATFADHLPVVRQLLRAGTHDTRDSNGTTALEWAERLEHDDIVKCITKWLGDTSRDTPPIAKDEDEDTPRDEAPCEPLPTRLPPTAPPSGTGGGEELLTPLMQRRLRGASAARVASGCAESSHESSASPERRMVVEEYIRDLKRTLESGLI